MATLANTTNYDRAAIMQKAWRGYRFQMSWKDDKTFDRALFGQVLAYQWECARQDCADAIARAAEAAGLANASAIDQRIAAIKSEMKDMEYGERIDWTRRSALDAELARLAA